MRLNRPGLCPQEAHALVENKTWGSDIYEHEWCGSAYGKSGGKGQGIECYLVAQGKLVHSLGYHLLIAEGFIPPLLKLVWYCKLSAIF